MRIGLTSSRMQRYVECGGNAAALAAYGGRRRAKAGASPPHSTGFTFIEILVTLTLLSIVLPGIMTGISLSLAAGKRAQQQSQASSLAYSKLMEISSLGIWQQDELAGDFSPDWPEYRWAAEITEWDGLVLQQLDVIVSWEYEGVTRSVRMSTLVQASQAGVMP